MEQLRAGDCLIYRPHTLMGWLIAIKTWSRLASHVEVYVGAGTSAAARDGIGVGLYRLRTDQLAVVLRPKAKFDLHRAMAWFTKVKGQGYDWLGLLCFTLAVRQGSPDKQFCSEFALNFYRAGGVELFSPNWLADETAPAQFLQTPELDTIWTAPT